MIFDKILKKFGYVRKGTINNLELEAMGASRREKIVREQNNMLQNKIEKLENENENLKDQAWELKERLCDETQKRFELREKAVELESWRDEYDFLRDRYLEAMKQIEKLEKELEREEVETIWRDAKKDPPENSRDVLIWSETGPDVGYYDVTVGWLRKDGVIIDVRLWSEFSEPAEP